MNLTLVGSHTSPYVRKIRLYLLANGIEFTFKAINYLEKNDSEYLLKINPINKIPVLLIDNEQLWDSRVIFNYLNHTLLHSPLTLEEENILSAIDGLLDATIALFMMKRGGINIAESNMYFDRQKKRIQDLIEFLKPWAQNASEWNFLTMSFYSFIDWANFREMISINSHPYMQTFMDKFKLMPHVEETKIRV